MSAFTGWCLACTALCAAGAAGTAAVPQRRRPGTIACFGALAALAVIGLGATVLAGPAVSANLWSIPGIGTMVLRADGLAGVFLVVTGLVFLPASVFAASALPRLADRHNLAGYGAMHFALLLSIVWILLSGDVFSLFVAWEIMSLLCYLLVSFEHERAQHRSAGYLMVGTGEAGTLAALIGVLVLAVHAGSLDFSLIGHSSTGLGSGTRLAVFLLTFAGFGVKAGLVPVNFWLPGAYAAAPAAFAPVLAGATLNLGLYGILRVNADLLPATTLAPGLIALIIGTVSALIGILYATTDNDLRVLLAHSSVENAGIIAASIGAGLVFTAQARPALAAMAFLVALYHLVNHSLYKALLFIGAGVVDDRAGTRDLDQLGGLIHRMPWTALGMLVGSLSIAALPPFNGFVSEWLTLQTLLRSVELTSTGVKLVFALCGAGLALTLALAVTCFVKLFAMAFLGMTRSDAAANASETTSAALAPMAFLGLLCLLLGVLPTYAVAALDRAVRPVAGSSALEALVPPFFSGSPGHETLPPALSSEFHAIGAQVGQGVMPGPGLVLLHQGGLNNPVVFAGAPTYLVLVLAGVLGLTLVLVRYMLARHRIVTRGATWAGGIRRLLPEMTYTATGFSNPVRVIFQAVFRPTTVEDTQEAVFDHFSTAIRRDSEAVPIVERLVLRPVPRGMLRVARFLARMHRGRLNAYIGYVLLALLAALAMFAILQ